MKYIQIEIMIRIYAHHKRICRSTVLTELFLAEQSTEELNACMEK